MRRATVALAVASTALRLVSNTVMRGRNLISFANGAGASGTTAAPRTSRRSKKMYVAIAILLALAVYGFLIEPYWIAVRRIRLSSEPALRIVHLSDLHYWGNRAYFQKVVAGCGLHYR
jgi:hypothetical protein